MMEIYEPMELDIRELPEEDVITVSGLVAQDEDHDNGFLSAFGFSD